MVEFLDRILPGFDGEVAKQSQRIFQKQGLAVPPRLRVTAVREGIAGVTVAPAKGEGELETVAADVVVRSAAGPIIEGLGLKEAGVALDERGRIATDGHFKTNVEGIYGLAMRSPGRCSRTRPRTKASPWRRSLRPGGM